MHSENIVAIHTPRKVQRQNVILESQVIAGCYTIIPCLLQTGINGYMIHIKFFMIGDKTSQLVKSTSKVLYTSNTMIIT